VNVLITSASRKIALVRAFQRAITEVCPSGRVVAADISPHAAALYAADKGCLLPRTDNPGFINRLVELCAREKIQLIVPTRDEELPLFAEHRDFLEKSGTRVMVAPPSVIRQCQDKQAFLGFCVENGFNHARLIPQSAWAEAKHYPLFFRPRFGKGGSGARRINNWPELQTSLASCPDGIVQECVDAPEYTVDVFADFSGHVLSAVPRRRISVWGGESFVSRTETRPLLIAESVRLAQRLGLIGHNTIQCFLRQNEVLFIEVNPRFGGAANLGIAAGADTPLFLLSLMAGREVESRVGVFTDQLTMLRYTDDLFLEPEQLLKESK